LETESKENIAIAGPWKTTAGALARADHTECMGRIIPRAPQKYQQQYCTRAGLGAPTTGRAGKPAASSRIVTTLTASCCREKILERLGYEVKRGIGL